jgi:hypothetical protein
LRIRPGARFTCHADGPCCRSIHALGPILPAEVLRLGPRGRRWTEHDDSVGGLAFRYDARDSCHFRQDDGLCGVHARLGLAAKPAVCRRFPYALVDAPDGLRVTTPHRCPCRTLGDRAPVTAEVVWREIAIDGMPLPISGRVGARLRLDATGELPFERWRTLEAQLLARLAAGDDPARVLGVTPFTPLVRADWEDIADTLSDGEPDSSFAVARAWVGDAIASALDGIPMRGDRERPWAAAFDRVARRLGVEQPARTMLADWLADELWSLDWTRLGSFARGRLDLATRLELVKVIARTLAARGRRGDLATAEALMIVDVVGHSDHWDEAANALPARVPRRAPLPFRPTRWG